jgi:hypothetical protein
MNSGASPGPRFRSKLRGIYPRRLKTRKPGQKIIIPYRRRNMYYSELPIIKVKMLIMKTSVKKVELRIERFLLLLSGVMLFAITWIFTR